MTRSPAIATASANPPPIEPLVAASLEPSCQVPLAMRRNMRALPAPEIARTVSSGEPTTTRSSAAAIEAPKSSPDPPSLDESRAADGQLVSVTRWYTNAAPEPRPEFTASGAPTNAQSPSSVPDSATALPNPIVPDSPAVSATASTHEPPVLRKMYAPPAPAERDGAPMSARDDCAATDAPKRSPAAPFEAVTFAACVQVLPEVLRNTYAAPRSAAPEMSAPGAPMTTMSPFIATAEPKPSPPAPSEATSFATCDQLEPLLRKTYTAPWSPLAAPPASGAPTTITLPSSATALPNASDAPVSLPSSVAVSGQVLLEPRSNTVTVPSPDSAPGAPNAARPLSAATAEPNSWPDDDESGLSVSRSLRVVASCARAGAAASSASAPADISGREGARKGKANDNARTHSRRFRWFMGGSLSQSTSGYHGVGRELRSSGEPFHRPQIHPDPKKTTRPSRANRDGASRADLAEVSDAPRLGQWPAARLDHGLTMRQSSVTPRTKPPDRLVRPSMSQALTSPLLVLRHTMSALLSPSRSTSAATV